MDEKMLEAIKRKKRGGRPRSSKHPDNATLLLLYETHTSREIAELYDVPLGSVRPWISLARKEREANGR